VGLQDGLRAAVPTSQPEPSGFRVMLHSALGRRALWSLSSVAISSRRLDRMIAGMRSDNWTNAT